MADPDVLVVGAGPVGLMMAGELARHGVTCRLIDRSEAPATESRAIGLWSRTLEIFEDVGVIDEILARGERVHGNNIYADGKRIVHMTFDMPDVPYAYGVALPQTDTEAILAAAAAKRGVAVERRTALERFAQDDGGVTATLRGPSGGVEELRVRWIVGCDGAHSTVRHALGLAFDGAPYPDVWYAADVQLDWELPRDELHNFLSPIGIMAVFVLPGERRVRLVYDHPTRRGDDPRAGHGSHVPPPTLDEVQAAFDARTGMRGALSDPRWLAGFRIHRRAAAAHRVGRAFLAGDAAHIHSPVGAQGMNTGLQDAYNLGWKLALVQRGVGRAALVDSYQAERHPIAAATVRGTDRATRMVTLRNPVARWARDRLIEVVAAHGSVQDRMMRQAGQLALSYRSSPIVGEHRAGIAGAIVHERGAEHAGSRDWLDFGAAPRAGDRAPDAHYQDDHRLFDLLRGTHHTLLLFGGAAPTDAGDRKLDAIAADVGQRLGRHGHAHVVVPRGERPAALSPSTSVVLDADGELHGIYGAGSECLYLVRPGGYVAFRSQPADGAALGAYLNRIFAA
jgi:2-polyprenyl-6-methoxyphenol hydroxylase-like FAD-dependent oxidoreductase